MTEAFNSQSVAFVDPQDTSRTFYMVASTDQERDAWIEAIQGNISAYVVSTNSRSYGVECVCDPPYIAACPIDWAHEKKTEKFPCN